MKFYSVFLLAFVLISASAQAFFINEIMPNPENETNEWVEIYNPGDAELNLSLFVIGDEYSNKSISFEGSTNATYFLVVGENANISEITNESITYFRTEGKIGNGLRNGGESVYIYNSTVLLDNTSYPSFSSREGYSWCRMENGTWIYCRRPTPGFPNNFANITENKTGDNQTNTTNNTCDLRIWIKCNNTFVMGSSKYYPMVEDLMGGVYEPEVEYWIEDMFGGIARSKVRTNNTNVAKSWTPPEINGTEAYVIRAEITREICNDTNLSNNHAEKLIIVKGEQPYSEKGCSCETRIIETEKPCSCSPCPKCVCENEETKKENEIEIISCPGEVVKNEEVEIKVRIENPSVYQRNYTVYSYVYDGKKPLSLGFDGNNWSNTWDANKQELNLPRKSSANLTLTNRIADDTRPGKYKLRIRIKFNDEKKDITKDIIIKEAPEESIDEVMHENEANETTEREEIKLPTGRITSERKNWFAGFIEDIVNFFKNLFRI